MAQELVYLEKEEKQVISNLEENYTNHDNLLNKPFTIKPGGRQKDSPTYSNEEDIKCELPAQFPSAVIPALPISGTCNNGIQPTHLSLEDYQCVICWDAIIDACSLLCSHTFCAYCINKWVSRRPRCPVCRFLVVGMTDDLEVNAKIEAAIAASPKAEELIAERTMVRAVRRKDEEERKMGEFEKRLEGGNQDDVDFISEEDSFMSTEDDSESETSLQEVENDLEFEETNDNTIQLVWRHNDASLLLVCDNSWESESDSQTSLSSSCSSSSTSSTSLSLSLNSEFSSIETGSTASSRINESPVDAGKETWTLAPEEPTEFEHVVSHMSISILSQDSDSTDEEINQNAMISSWTEDVFIDLEIHSGNVSSDDSFESSFGLDGSGQGESPDLNLLEFMDMN